MAVFHLFSAPTKDLNRSQLYCRISPCLALTTASLVLHKLLWLQQGVVKFAELIKLLNYPDLKEPCREENTEGDRGTGTGDRRDLLPGAGEFLTLSPGF